MKNLTMKKNMVKCATLCAAALIAGGAMGWTGDVCGQKFIGHGWDLMMVSPEEILDHADAFDATGLDGIAVALRGKEPGEKVWRYSHSRIHSDKPWPRELVAQHIAPLKKFKEHRGLKDSMLIFWMSPRKRMDWRDDAAWERFAGNVATLAWVGRESGLHGYILDSEDYGKQKQFYLNGDMDNMDYDTACAVARRRGAQVFSALFREHPDATLLSFWFLSEGEAYYVNARHPVREARKRGDLWPSFVNGLLDVLPPKAKFVDGNEHAYGCKADTKGFYVKSYNQSQGLLGLVAPENRMKFQTQLSVGFGQYLDMYVNGPENRWYVGPAEDGSRLTAFERNLEQAAQVSTEYVWIYGEKHCWVDWKKTRKNEVWRTKCFLDAFATPTPTWEKCLPGLADALRALRDPDAFREQKLAEMKAAGTLVELCKDSACRGGEGLKEGFNPRKLPIGFHNYRSPESTNLVCGIDTTVGEGDSFSVAIRGGPFGNVSCGTAVKQDEIYALAVSVKSPKAAAEACWCIEGQWKWVQAPQMDFGEPNADGWRRGSLTVRIPKGATRLGLFASAKLKDGEMAWFDNFSIVKLR